MPRIPEKAVDLLATTGFAAAGVVSVVAQNLRTLADRDEALTDRAKQVAQNSLGAVLGGPAALTDRGRQLVGRDGARSNGSTRTIDGPAQRERDTSAAKVTAKTVAPAERPDRSKAEEARDRQVVDDDGAARARGAEESRKRAEETEEQKPAARATEEKKEEPAAKETGKKKPAPKKAEAKKTTKTGKTEAKKSAPKKTEAKKAEAPETGTADPDRSVEEQRAAQKTAKKKQQAKAARKGAEADDTPPEGLPAGVDEQLVADLQRMTVKQLRDRAAQDGVPGRSEMGKDELVVALATRETDDVPAKA